MSSDAKTRMTNSHKIVGNTLLSSLSEISLLFTSLFYMMAARYLGDVQFGKLGTALGFAGIFTLVVYFGFNYSITKVIIKEKKNTSNFVGNALFIQWILALLFFGVCMGTSFLFPEKYTKEVQFLLAIVYVAEMLRSFNLTLRASCKALNHFKFDTLAVNAERFFLIIVGGTLIFSGFGVFWVAGTLAVSRFLSFILLILFLSRAGFRPSFLPSLETIRYLVRNSYIYVVQSAFWRVYDHIDVFMISIMRPFAEVGWYRAGRQILEGLWFIPNILTEAIYPELNARHLVSREQVFKLFDKSFKYMLVMAVMVTVGTLVIAKSLVLLVYGDAFEKTGLVLMLLGTAILPSYLRYMCGNTLIAINLQKKEMRISAGRSLFNVAANLALIPFWGYLGATVATVATDYLSTFFYMRELGKAGLIRRSQWRFAYKPFAALLLLAPVYALIHRLHDFLQFFILMGFYMLFVLLLKIFDEDEIDVFKQFFFRRLKGMKR